jgi:hypothetical protein
VTATLTEIVEHDLALLDTPGKARFPAICVDHWPPYRERLSGDERACRVILQRYRSYLSVLAEANAPYVSNLRLGADGSYVAAVGQIGESDRLLFEELVAGYMTHVELLQNGARAAEVAAFGVAVNDRLRADLFT